MEHFQPNLFGLPRTAKRMFCPGTDSQYQVLVWLILLFTMVLIPTNGAAAQPPPPFRVGFSSTIFSDLNNNDARAAIKAWGKQVARDQHLPSDPVPAIFNNLDALYQALEKKQVDAVGITAIEYDQLRTSIDLFPLFVTYKQDLMFEQYVLLANQDSTVKTLFDLAGKSLAFHLNPRVCLAPMWLDTLLVDQGCPRAGKFVDKILWEKKLVKAVLPVFFKKIHACVVTRSGFDTLAELNPQLAEQLIIIAQSPEIVPSIFVFRADYTPEYKEKLITGLKNLNKSPAGRQVLTIFQGDYIDEQPATCLGTAMELISTHQQLIQQGGQP